MTSTNMPKPGLRERKKADRQDTILRSAGELFARNGYPATSMEAIATAADISATTLYNYFGTKNQILLAMIARSDDEILRREAALELDHSLTGADHIVGFLRRLTLHALKQIDRGTWRYAIAHTLISEGDEDIKEEYGRINARLLSYVVSLLKKLKAEGLLCANGKVDPLAEMLFDMFRVLFIRLITSESMGERTHHHLLKRYVSAAIVAGTDGD